MEELPDLEVIAKLKELSPMMEVTRVLENKVVQEEENAKEEDNEQEKKKLRRRKKKHGSEDPEEINIGHRIVICDDQIDIQQSRPVRRASEVLPNSLLSSVRKLLGKTLMLQLQQILI